MYMTLYTSISIYHGVVHIYAYNYAYIHTYLGATHRHMHTSLCSNAHPNPWSLPGPCCWKWSSNWTKKSWSHILCTDRFQCIRILHLNFHYLSYPWSHLDHQGRLWYLCVCVCVCVCVIEVYQFAYTCVKSCKQCVHLLACTHYPSKKERWCTREFRKKYGFPLTCSDLLSMHSDMYGSESMHVWLYVCKRVCVFVGLTARMYVHVYIHFCMHVCMYLCEYICLCFYVYLYVCTYMYVYI